MQARSRSAPVLAEGGDRNHLYSVEYSRHATLIELQAL